MPYRAYWERLETAYRLGSLPTKAARADLGEPLYQCQPPTGYKDTADAWVNTGALVGRMNFGLALAGNKLRGVVVSNAQPDGVELGKPEFQRR